MSDLVFNIAKGRVGYYASLPAANDALIAVPIMTTGIVSDATMRDYADLSTLLAGASDEQTTMGRKVLGSVTSAVDNTNDKWVADAADITWSGASGSAVSAIVICYSPDTTSGAGGLTAGAYDSNLIPLVKLDFVVTPSGSDITAVFNAAGFFNAS